MILEFILAALLRAAPSDTGRFVTPDGARLYREECGGDHRAPTLVLLHDGLMHSATWDDVWPLLCAHYHVIRYDRRGMGRSDPPRQPFVPTEDLTALLADRGVHSATLVGSSSGAGLAIDFAIRHPDKVDRLVLIGPVVHGMGSSQHFLERGARNNAPLARGDTKAAAYNWSRDRYQIAGNHEHARRALFDALRASPWNLQYDGSLELRFAVPAATRMAEIRVPALVLVGEADIPDVQAYAGAVELGIWGAEREVVTDAGHLIQLEQPEFLARRITDFIAQTPVAAVAETLLASYAGTYNALMYGRAGELVEENGRLVLRTPTERDLPLFPSSDSTFYALVRGGVHITVHRDGRGRADALEVKDANGSRRAERQAK